MTGKLIKYEIKSSCKLFGVIWIALLVAAFLVSMVSEMMTRITPVDFENNGISTLLQIVPVFIYIAIFVALVVVTIVIIIMRFYKGLLTDEGYLMHTLPVKPWQLITAKGTVATGIVIISIIAATLSIFILNGLWNLGEIFDVLVEIAEFFCNDPKYLLVLIEGIFLIVASIMVSVYHVYAALTIGQLSNKYRLVISLAAYIGIETVISFIGTAVIMIASETGIDYWLVNMLDNMSEFGAIQLTIIAVIAVTLIFLAIFHVISERLLSKKLNLL